MRRTRGSSCGWAMIVTVVGTFSGCAKEAPPQPEPVTKEAAPKVVVTTPPADTPAKPVPVPPLPGAAETATAAANPQAPAAETTAPKVLPNNAPTAAPNAAPTVAVVVTVPPAPVEAPTPVPPSPLVTTPPPAPEAPPPPPVESPKQSAQAFSVWLQSSGKYSAGQQGTVEAVVVPKGEFHCNQEYPYKFVTSAGSSGVTYPKATVRGDGLSVSTNRAVMRVPFVPQNAGEAKVGGTFHFSVCTDSQCVVEKRDVFVTVKVQ